MEIINGPEIPGQAGEPMYQITLPSGAILTRPSAFAGYDPDARPFQQQIVVTETGEVIGPWSEAAG